MHDHHDHHHHHTLDITHVSRMLVIGIVLNLVFVVVEFASGFLSNSLSLMSDAGHNLSDVASLGLALVAFKLFKVKATEKYTYGYRKASILISLLNAVILLIAVGGIGYESFYRIFDPEPVKAGYVIVVAAIGIVINGLSTLLFFRSKEHDLNAKGAYLHLMVDALVSVGVVVSGVVIRYTEWTWVDPAISLVIMIVIVSSTWRLLRDSLLLSIDAVPRDINMNAIREAAAKLPGVKDIHHIHVWAISTSENALTAHLTLTENLSPPDVAKLKHTFKHDLQHLGIQHATLETETADCRESSCNVPL
ncbi:cation transporter [Chryseolinea sp. Jin1]|uniref:Cation transporter n=2 Tax=Chryseolinea lacunae TaxID=2801331 RepID=A0ABS1KLI8_9BACT|nr:cation diffusion facilitator family transporter [Chryseolinea lacunae]MBL0740098.1 cation transporter [Chryseolinea lacunae]